MDLGLSGKLALVTGASRGLGLASARVLVREGADVILFARSRERLEQAKTVLKNERGEARVDVYVGDLTKREDLHNLFKYLEHEYGELHILVYSTGGPKPGGFFELTDEDWEQTYRLLVSSAIITSREAAKLMMKKRWGRIVYIASITLLKPLRNLASSNVLRTPIAGLVKDLALELAPYNVTVNAVLPSFVLTDRVRELAEAEANRLGVSPDIVIKNIAEKIPLKRLGNPEEVGSVVAFLASEKASFITGSLVVVDGGFSLT
ncbi:MAG: SDR family oxidoreductase [Acidilobaceae archaeon]